MADEWAVLPGGEEKKDEEEGDGGVLGGAPNDGDDDDDFHDDGRGSVFTSFTAAAPVSHIDDDGNNNNNNSESTFLTLSWMTSWFSSHHKHSEFWRIYLGHDHEPTPTPQDHQDDFQENVDDASDEQEDDATDSSESDEQEDDASDSSDSDMNSVFSPLFDDFTNDYNYAPQDTKRQTFRIRTTPSQGDKRCLPKIPSASSFTLLY
jgi:hypothetical protein